MQQWWFDYGLRLKSVIYGGFFFYNFPLIFKIFINIHEYTNKVICISGHEKRHMSNLQFGTKISSL